MKDSNKRIGRRLAKECGNGRIVMKLRLSKERSVREVKSVACMMKTSEVQCGARYMVTAL